MSQCVFVDVMHVCVCVCVCACACTCARACMRVCMYMCACTCTCVCVCVHVKSHTPTVSAVYLGIFSTECTEISIVTWNKCVCMPVCVYMHGCAFLSVTEWTDLDISVKHWMAWDLETDYMHGTSCVRVGTWTRCVCVEEALPNASSMALATCMYYKNMYVRNTYNTLSWRCVCTRMMRGYVMHSPAACALRKCMYSWSLQYSVYCLHVTHVHSQPGM